MGKILGKLHPVSINTRKNSAPCEFDKLFARNVPHILEAIFLSLDCKSFRSCLMVNKTWNEFLMSDSFIKKAESTFDEWLLEASFEGHPGDVKLMLNMGINPDKPYVDEYGGWNAMVFAAAVGHKDVVKVLLDKGSNPNWIDENSSHSALARASKEGHEDVVKLLLDGGADPNIGLVCETLPLHNAAYEGHKNIVKLLLDRGADPAKEDSYGNTALDLAEIAPVVPEGMVKLIEEYLNTEYWVPIA